MKRKVCDCKGPGRGQGIDGQREAFDIGQLHQSTGLEVQIVSVVGEFHPLSGRKTQNAVATRTVHDEIVPRLAEPRGNDGAIVAGPLESNRAAACRYRSGVVNFYAVELVFQTPE